ncbi:hypothetical protein SN13_23340 [Vibrio alginolyticus]|uniref:hypothetical protein n=1 Tax=Vibrio alginolyticus TaxID=663 RepID=UPI0005ACBDCB|nr:hypothetical protein [Vibrio alginolyticus]KIP65161.1 hypothetical protein SN12_23395 [Vibrio alginolyticus]KIP78599.1 hypothetical protein SN13_23340 [Vibrio alginolyticus]
MKTCRLCKNSAELKNSHIFPRSIYKNLKKGSGQLLNISVDKPLETKPSNSNPTELLLCGDCEQFLNKNYEGYGTRLLKQPKQFKAIKDGLIIKKFKFNKFYLYLISILWRASESTLPEFSTVDLGAKFNEYLRYCVLKQSTKLSSTVKLEHFIRISMVKLVDPSLEISPETMRQFLMYVTKEVGESPKEPILYYFVVDGFLIIYHLCVYNDIHEQRTQHIAAQLTNSYKVFVPKVDYRTFKFLNQAFGAISQYNEQK